MATPMQRFSQRRQQEKRAATALKSPAILQAEDSLHVQLIALSQDVARLRSLPTIADRLAMKRGELLPRWQPLAKKYLDSGREYLNPILSYVIIWLLDIRRLALALEWSKVAVAQGQQTPDHIKSSLPAFVADQIYAWAEVELEQNRTVEPYFSEVFQLVTQEWHVHERIKSKFYRMAGLLLIRGDDGSIEIPRITDASRLSTARSMLIKARDLHQKAPVKTVIDRITMRLRRLTGDEKATHPQGALAAVHS